MTTDSVKVEGQRIRQTYKLDADVVGEPMIGSLQCDFPLCEADYLRLTTRGSKLTNAWVAVLLLSAGYGISIAAKKASGLWAGPGTRVEQWEYWALAIGVFIAIALAVVCRFVPNEKRTLLKKMKQHFESHPRQRKVMRRIDD